MTCNKGTCFTNFILLTLVGISIFAALTASYTIIRVFAYFIVNKDIFSICMFIITIALIILLISTSLYYKVKKEEFKYESVILPYYIV